MRKAWRHISDQNAANLLAQPTAATFYYLLLKEKVGRHQLSFRLSTDGQAEEKRRSRKILNFLKLFLLLTYNIFVSRYRELRINYLTKKTERN